MDAADLKVFEAVARLGGMNRAAAELNTVQSNVTARIRALEADIGSVPARTPQPRRDADPAGPRLLPYADKVAHCWPRRGARRATTGSRVAADRRLAGDHRRGSPDAAADALRGRPRRSIWCCAPAPRASWSSDVLEQRVEGAFVCGPVAHPELDEQAMFREELVVLTAPGVASLEARSAPASPPGRAPRGLLLSADAGSMLARRGIVVQRQLEFGTLEAIFGCVSAGLGITLLPRALVGSVCEAGRVAMHRLSPADAMVETIFIRRRDGFTSSAMQAFLACAGDATYSIDRQEAA